MQNRQLLYFLVTILFITASCSTGPNKANIAENRFDTLQVPSDSTALYFLSKKTQQDSAINSLDSFANSWYSKMLFVLKEPILNTYKGNTEIYRFTWLRTFDHPVSVRIEKQNDTVRVFVKVSNGAGGYEPGEIIVDTTFDISISDFINLNKKIDGAGFWQMPTQNRKNTGRDGSEWIIEGVKDKKYHMVNRWSPVKDSHDGFRSIGEFLIAISKIKGENDIY